MLKKILWAGNIAPIEGSRSRVPEKESGGGGLGDTLLSVASQEWYGTDLCWDCVVLENVFFFVARASLRKKILSKMLI
jgi:hypothetical protein